MIRFLTSILAAIFALSALHADERIDDLTQDSLQEAFRVLQKNYIRQEDLSYEELNKAALDGLLRRLNLGARLVSKNGEAAADGPEVEFYTDIITPTIGYLRLAEYTMDELDDFDDALASFEDAEIETLVLDLRAPQVNADLNAAARILDRFVPANTMLFKIQKPQAKRPQMYFSQASNQIWEGELVLLVDGDTSNAGEVVAALLNQMRDCVVVGSKTPGATVEYEQIALNETTFLKYAVAEVVLADESPLYQVGVEPDFEVEQDLKAKIRVYDSTKNGPIHQHIFEQARPRMNEAALVHETDPELDYHLARSRGEITEFDRVPLQDRVLQRAVDMLLTNAHFNSPADQAE